MQLDQMQRNVYQFPEQNKLYQQKHVFSGITLSTLGLSQAQPDQMEAAIFSHSKLTERSRQHFSV